MKPAEPDFAQASPSKQLIQEMARRRTWSWVGQTAKVTKKELTMDKLHYQIQDSVCTIHLDDGKVNAMNLVFFEELHAALDQAENSAAGPW